MLTNGKMKISGKVVLKLDDDVSTDAIYPGRYMATVLPGETPQFAFADLPEFNARLRKLEIPPGSVVAAGSNFGCGSSREQAASTLKGHELVIVARSYARIFLQNAVNLGLQIFSCTQLECSEGDELEIAESHIINKTTDKQFALQPLPAAKQDVIAAGGLIPYTRKRLMKKRA
jgi:3-isopropylmalate/(R)-2-methylmalate dehydratase small subunit